MICERARCRTNPSCSKRSPVHITRRGSPLGSSALVELVATVAIEIRHRDRVLEPARGVGVPSETPLQPEVIITMAGDGTTAVLAAIDAARSRA